MQLDEWLKYLPEKRKELSGYPPVISEFTCIKCGLITEIDNEWLERIRKIVNLEIEAFVHDKWTFYSRCDDCSQPIAVIGNIVPAYYHGGLRDFQVICLDRTTLLMAYATGKELDEHMATYLGKKKQMKKAKYRFPRL